MSNVLLLFTFWLHRKSDDDDDERPKANTILEKILACTDRIYKRDPCMLL